jgi:hypothetical protein
MIAAARLLLQAAPSAEALAAGERLARSGTVATLLPMMAAKETDELVAAHPELSAAEQAELRRVAAETLKTAAARLFAAEAKAYAERLSGADMEVLTARNTDAVAARWRAALPAAIAAAMGAMAGLDL